MKISTQATAGTGPDFDSELAKFTPRQMEAVRALDSGQIKFLLYGGALGGGKAQPIHEPVLTPFGWREIGSLGIGDTILNPDGKPQQVIAVHPQGMKPICHVTFNDGAMVDCELEHLWLVNKTQRHRSKRDQSFDPFIGNKFFGGEIWTTEKIKGWLKQHPAPRTQNLLIPLCEPLQFTKAYHPRNNPRKIHPYLLGVLLGDGCLKNLTPFFTSNDPEIASRLDGFGVKVRKRKSASAWGIVSSPEVRVSLGKCGLMNTGAESKFIPESYKWAPLDDRKLLIQGLMDTDGYVDKRGHCSFTSVSKTLAEDFQWVIRSMGGKATITTKQPFYKDKNTGVKVNGQTAYTLYFHTKIDPDLVWL